MSSVATRKLGTAKPTFATTIARVVGPLVRPERGEQAEGDPEHQREEHRERSELERGREVLGHDVVDVAVAQHERGAEVERGDVPDVVEVLPPPRIVEAVLLLEVLLDRLRDRPFRGPERVSLDLTHQNEGHEDDEEDHGDRPEHPADDEPRHVSSPGVRSGTAARAAVPVLVATPPAPPRPPWCSRSG